MRRPLISVPLLALVPLACGDGQMGNVTAPEVQLSVQEGYDEAGNDGSVPVGVTTASASIQLASPPPTPSCRPGNIQTLATASHSGGGQSIYGVGPEEGNDGVFGPDGDTPWSCSSWTWIETIARYPSGKWYELEWASPQRLGQIWVDTKAHAAECGAGSNRGLHGADIQTWDGSTWVMHGSETNATNDWGFVFPAATTTTKLRLFNIGPVSSAYQDHNPVLHELKVYDCSAIDIDIDIKPESDPNSIKCGAEEGTISVAILTTADFDATTVDHATVTFEGASETHTNEKTGEPRRHEEDVDEDGDIDLVLHFKLGDTSLTCDSTEGTLTGETVDGLAIEGTDAVQMVS